MNFDIVIVLAVLAFIILSLYMEWFGSSFTFLIAIILLNIRGILIPEEVLNGINEPVAVVILLLLYGEILRKTSVIENIFDGLFRKAKTSKGFMSRMMMTVATFSSCLNNTPLVAVMMPYVHNWCKKNRITPSKFLIPLSYAAILGGQITLIGTSTNIIVNSMVKKEILAGTELNIRELHMFDFAWVGIPMAIIGFFYLYFFSNRLLPEKKTIGDSYSTKTREYVVEARVRNDSHLIGKTVAEAGLRDLPGLYLVEILRRSFRLAPVSPEVILDRGDILVFAGKTDTIMDLIHSKGLVLPEVGMMSKLKKTEVVEVVVSQNSSLIHKSVKETNFRGKYDAAIIAVHRNGEKIEGKLGTVILKAGDVLLCYAGEDFVNRSTTTQDFYFISSVKDFTKLEGYKTAILFGGLFLLIILSALFPRDIPLFTGLIILIVISLLLNVSNPKDLPKSIDYNLALTIILSLALGTAMQKSGTAQLIANGIISLFLPTGKMGVLLGVYLITTILAAYITNKASVAIIFPIALETAALLRLNPFPFILVVAFASAANFMTPIGYQTNLMVYGPGGYSFKDFFRIGWPLTIIYMLVTVSILSLIYF